MLLTKKEARALLIGIAFIMGILGGLYWMSSRNMIGHLWRQRIFEKAEPPRYTPTGVRIPETVLTYNGRVKEKGEGYFIIHSRASNNYLETDADIRIDLAVDTMFVRYALPRGVGEGIEIITAIEEPITAEEVMLGDTVEVTSKQNIRGVHMVRAEEVKVMAF